MCIVRTASNLLRASLTYRSLQAPCERMPVQMPRATVDLTAARTTPLSEPNGCLRVVDLRRKTRHRGVAILDHGDHDASLGNPRQLGQVLVAVLLSPGRTLNVDEARIGRTLPRYRRIERVAARGNQQLEVQLAITAAKIHDIRNASRARLVTRRPQHACASGKPSYSGTSS